jgi:hypothetical protein
MKLKGCLSLCLAGMPTALVLACSCAAIPPIREGVLRSDVVVTGDVVSIDTVTIEPRSDGHTRQMIRYGILPEKFFKGDHADTLFVLSGRDVSECGFMFEIGKQYIVYATKADVSDPGSDVLHAVNVTSRCTRTRLYTEAEVRELELLR